MNIKYNSFPIKFNPNQLRQSDKTSKSHWKTSYKDKWNQSVLNTLVLKPQEDLMRRQYEKTLSLKIMSLDMNSAVQTRYSTQGKRLPKLKNKGKTKIENLEIVGKG